jgi:hypothetical protein
MSARVNEVCDAVVTAVLAAWNTSISPAAVAAPDSVERTYLTPVKFNSLTGRKVWVSPVGFGDENASRAENLGQYTVAVVVAERYEDAGLPSRAWLDTRVDFVELLYDLLGSYGNRRASGWLSAGTPARRHYTERAAVGEVYSFEYLDQQHVFWAEMELEFREVR